MMRRPPRSTLSSSSAASDVYKRQVEEGVVSGGGSAYIHASKKVAELVKTLSGDEKIGAQIILKALEAPLFHICLLYTSPSPRDGLLSRMPSSA